MPELTIKVSPGVSGKLKRLQDRINRNPAPAINCGLDGQVSKEQIAAVLGEMALSATSEDKIIFAVMVAQQQLFANNSKYRRKGSEKRG